MKVVRDYRLVDVEDLQPCDHENAVEFYLPGEGDGRSTLVLPLWEVIDDFAQCIDISARDLENKFAAVYPNEICRIHIIRVRGMSRLVGVAATRFGLGNTVRQQAIIDKARARSIVDSQGNEYARAFGSYRCVDILLRPLRAIKRLFSPHKG